MSGLAQTLPQAWQRRAPWLWCLLPLSALYAAVTASQRALYRVGLKHAYRAPVPVMIIGNITVGGSGKTPLIIELVRYLRDERGLRVGVISRGYGGAGPFPRRVLAADLPQVVGDEPALIVQQTGVPMAVGANRRAAIECLLAAHDLDLILSDDGLQHLALARDIEWIVLDTKRGTGNGFLLPAGPLRESASRLQRSTVIEHGLSDSALQMQLVPQPLQPLIHPNPSLAKDEAPPCSKGAGGILGDLSPPQQGDTVHAVAGIGDPSRFFNSLRQLGFVVIEHAFADHHAYTAQDVQFDDDFPMITTAKDAVKLAVLGVQGWVLPVVAQLSPACYAQLDAELLRLNVG